MRPTPDASAKLARLFARAMGLLALGMLAYNPPAFAEGATASGAADLQRALPAATGSREARPIIALLQRLDRQIAENRLVEPQDDNVAKTLETIIGLLERAPVEDVQLLIDLPSHLARRADQAAGSGRDAEAKRFIALAAMVSRSSPSGAAERNSTQNPQIPAPGKEPFALTEPSPVNGPAHDVASLRQGESADESQPLAPNTDQSSAMEAPSATDAAPPDILDASSWHFDKSTLGRLVAPPQLPTVFVTPPVLREAAVGTPTPPVMMPPTTRAPVRATAVNSRCRSIAQKFAIGEVPSEAERDYLREGCQGG